MRGSHEADSIRLQWKTQSLASLGNKVLQEIYGHRTPKVTPVLHGQVCSILTPHSCSCHGEYIYKQPLMFNTSLHWWKVISNTPYANNKQPLLCKPSYRSAKLPPSKVLISDWGASCNMLFNHFWSVDSWIRYCEHQLTLERKLELTCIHKHVSHC